MSEVSTEQAIEQVLHPELAPGDPFTVGPYKITLRPLPIKHAKILGKKVEPIEEYLQQPDLSAFSALGRVSELFIDAATHLLSFYGIEGASKEWLEDTLEFGDIRELITIQMQMQKRDDFLLLPLRLLSERMLGATQKIAEKPVEVVALPSPETPST